MATRGRKPKAAAAAVNADGTYGKWLYAICRKPEDVSKAITAAMTKVAEMATATVVGSV